MAESEPGSGNTDQLNQMYNKSKPDHAAETLDDFGVPLPVGMDEGILVPLSVVETATDFNIPRHPKVQHAVLRPVGVGPSQSTMFRPLSGTVVIFTEIYPAEVYGTNQQHVLGEDTSRIARFERDQLEMYAEEHPVVETVGPDSGHEWQPADSTPPS